MSCFFHGLAGCLGVCVLDCLAACAPASNPCGSIVAGTVSDEQPIPNYASYGGQIVWNGANGENHCTAVFQASTAEGSLRSVGAFHCMRNLVLDYMLHGNRGKQTGTAQAVDQAEVEFPLYIALNVVHAEGNACTRAGGTDKLVYVRIPVEFKDINFLVDLEKKYRSIYDGMSPDKQASGEWVREIKSREKKWIEHFYDKEKAGDFKTTVEDAGDELDLGEGTERMFESLACSTQHYDGPGKAQYMDYFGPFLRGKGLKLNMMCFLHSDVAVIDIELPSNLQFEPENKACLHAARLNHGTEMPLWALHK